MTAPRSTKPTIKARAAEPICPNCGGPVLRRSPKGPVPTFCDAKGVGVCKREHFNRHVAEGRAVMALLKAWRIDRGTGEIAKAAFAQVCAITDQFNARDAEKKRPRADLYAAKLMSDGSMYIDRQRQPAATPAV